MKAFVLVKKSLWIDASVNKLQIYGIEFTDPTYDMQRSITFNNEEYLFVDANVIPANVDFVDKLLDTYDNYEYRKNGNMTGDIVPKVEGLVNTRNIAWEDFDKSYPYACTALNVGRIG